ncbi:MAG: hypothetical protein ACTSRZ_08180 [Promethearchaeota archaeon]
MRKYAIILIGILAVIVPTLNLISNLNSDIPFYIKDRPSVSSLNNLIFPSFLKIARKTKIRRKFGLTFQL